MLRALVERLPLMVTPRWVKTRTQPIAIEDVVAYLLEALDYQPDGGEVFEIGGADVCSYLDLMHEYAEQRGLRRRDGAGSGVDATALESLASSRHARVRRGGA